MRVSGELSGVVVSSSEGTASGPSQLTPAEAGRVLDVSPSTIRRWIADGSVPALRIGGRYRIEECALRRMIVRTGTGDE